MAKVKLSATLNGDEIGQFYNADSLDLRTHRDGKAVYVDTDSGNRIVFEGNDFSFKGDHIRSGEVHEITFTNDSGKEYEIALNVDMSAERLSSLLLDKGVQAMMRTVLNDHDTIYGSGEADVLFGAGGDDVLKARGGGDELDGGQGDDRLVGGGGSDLFIFTSGGDDIIADFDATGGGNGQDYIGVESMNNFRIRDEGDDVVLHFDNGDTLTLLDVKRSAISDADFQLV